MQNGATLECPKCHSLLTCYIGSPTRCACGQVIQLQLQMAQNERKGAQVYKPSQAPKPVPAGAQAPVQERVMNTGRWTREEHEAFVQGLDLYGREWKKVANLIPTRTVVQIRTHAQKYFQKLAKGNAAANKEEAPRRGRPRKKTARPSSLAVPSAGGRAVKKPRGFNDSTQPHLLIRHRSYVGRSENPIASSVPASARQAVAAAGSQPPTPRTMRAAVTLVDQRTTARLQAGKDTPRTRAAAEWLAGLHAEGRYSWSAAANNGPGAAIAAASAGRKGVPAASFPVHPPHPAHPAPYHPQYQPRAGIPTTSTKPKSRGPRMGLIASADDNPSPERATAPAPTAAPTPVPVPAPAPAPSPAPARVEPATTATRDTNPGTAVPLAASHAATPDSSAAAPAAVAATVAATAAVPAPVATPAVASAVPASQSVSTHSVGGTPVAVHSQRPAPTTSTATPPAVPASTTPALPLPRAAATAPTAPTSAPAVPPQAPTSNPAAAAQQAGVPVPLADGHAQAPS